MQRIAVVPGSFDPVTLGHLDVIERAAGLYDQLHVVVVHNPDKSALLPIAQRVALIEQAIADAHIPGDIVVASWSMGLLVDYCRRKGAGTIVRGLRALADFEYEFQFAVMNRRLAPSVDTMFLMTAEENFYVSSSLVKEVAGFGGDVSGLVPPTVNQALCTRFAKGGAT